MADQEQVPQGAIPPKVTPFAKPEGASPVTPVVPGAPRPITIRLRPVMPPSAAAPAAGVPPPPSANPHATSRVPLPEGVAAAPATPGTVHLRPAAPAGASAPLQELASGHAPGSTQPIAQMSSPSAAGVSPMQPQHPPTPGSNPLPVGPKPPSGAQVQAAKSKTSRISLDSAIGVAPMTPMSGDKSEPKTIRLKRPTDLAAPTAKVATSPIRQTSRIPDSALPTAAEVPYAETAGVTQKKTLKIKRPGAKEGGGQEEAGAGEAFPEGVQMTPVGALGLPGRQESSVFTVVAVTAAALAAILLVLLTLCLGAHAVAPVAGRNALAFVKGPELPWFGRIVN